MFKGNISGDRSKEHSLKLHIYHKVFADGKKLWLSLTFRLILLWAVARAHELPNKSLTSSMIAQFLCVAFFNM